MRETKLHLRRIKLSFINNNISIYLLKSIYISLIKKINGKEWVWLDMIESNPGLSNPVMYLVSSTYLRDKGYLEVDVGSLAVIRMFWALKVKFLPRLSKVY
jgi:hypothetical protein